MLVLTFWGFKTGEVPPPPAEVKKREEENSSSRSDEEEEEEDDGEAFFECWVELGNTRDTLELHLGKKEKKFKCRYARRRLCFAGVRIWTAIAMEGIRT